jgi:uncharacterized phage protein (TIGR02218 family)
MTDLAAWRAHMATGDTTRATCWRLERRDGVVMGFTDHDRDIVFDGLTFAAAQGLGASEAAQSLGLAADDIEVAGALSSGAITEAALAAGLYDGAEVRVFDVNWAGVAVRALMGVYHIGEVTRGEAGFAAELRSRSALLGRKRGRHLTATCDAELGDTRCGVAMGPWTAAGAVTEVLSGGRAFVSSGLGGFARGVFTRGVLTWTTGPNVATAWDVRAHGDADVAATLELWRDPASAVSPGDAFSVTAGCDKSFETCRRRFANAINFRGFPHMPREDKALGYAVRGEAGQDGDTDHG